MNYDLKKELEQEILLNKKKSERMLKELNDIHRELLIAKQYNSSFISLALLTLIFYIFINIL